MISFVFTSLLILIASFAITSQAEAKEMVIGQRVPSAPVVRISGEVSIISDGKVVLPSLYTVVSAGDEIQTGEGRISLEFSSRKYGDEPIIGVTVRSNARVAWLNSAEASQIMSMKLPDDGVFFQLKEGIMVLNWREPEGTKEAYIFAEGWIARVKNALLIMQVVPDQIAIIRVELGSAEVWGMNEPGNILMTEAGDRLTLDLGGVHIPREEGKGQSESRSTAPTQSSKPGGECLVATAAFGGQLTHQVQFLRNLNNHVASGIVTIASSMIGALYFWPFASSFKQVRKGRFKYKLAISTIAIASTVVIGVMIAENYCVLMTTT